MTEREWLWNMMAWAVAKLQGDASAVERKAILEAGINAARAGDRPLPWDTVRSRLQLSTTEQETLALLLAVELSLEIGGLVAKLNGDERRPGVDVALLQRLVYATPEAVVRFVGELSPAGAMQRYHLVESAEPRREDSTPFLLRQLRPTRRMIELVHGATGLDPELAGFARWIASPRDHDHLRLSDEIKQRIAELARTLDARARAGDLGPVLVVSGPEGAGRRSLLEGVAHAIGRSVVLIDCSRLSRDPAVLDRRCRLLLRDVLLLQAMPILHCADELRGDAVRPDIARIVDDQLVWPYPGVVAATLPKSDAKPGAFERGLVLVELDVPEEIDRRTLWQTELCDRAVDGVPEWAAARYTVTGGVIQRAARSAVAEAQARGEQVGREDVHVAIRSSLDSKISAIARRLKITQGWSDVVLPDDVMDEVREIVSRVKHRELVYDQWGLGDKIGKGTGISVLLSGPPGTGKTMIAGIIAKELGLDLYQVDLAQIVSKYIGETEKNLSNLFDAAEAGHAVLLFDEADSMFAKRTDVKSSTDRYANLEVNFLLQRMETFRGTSILTTNLETSIDDAFKRRLSFRITFPLPDEEERRRLWETLLPPRAKLAERIDFSRLADKFEMSGGYIKNAVVRAAFMAADRSEPLGESHLLRAAALEYAAMGKLIHTSR